MNQNTYPKIFSHRNDARSQVVVANAEQEAELPAEYLPEVVGVSGQTMSGADHAAAVLLSPAYDQVMAEREALERARTEFAALVEKSQKDLAEQAQKLADERAELTAGYKASVDKLAIDRDTLDHERAKMDEEKRQLQEGSKPAGDAPAKRTRTAKE
jgi:hypothetical protein